MSTREEDKTMYYGIAGVVVLLLLGGAFFAGKKIVPAVTGSSK